MNSIFPDQFYFKFSVSNAESLIDEITNDIDILKEEDLKWSTLCDVSTTKLDVSKYGNYLLPTLNQLSQELKKPIEFELVECWANKYSRGSFQEIHDHQGYDLVSVFFLNVEEDFSKFYFYNRSSFLLTPSWNKLVSDDTENNNIDYKKIDVKSGDILFFPSHMLHGVTKHNSEIIRKTFSCNYYMTVY